MSVSPGDPTGDDTGTPDAAPVSVVPLRYSDTQDDGVPAYVRPTAIAGAAHGILTLVGSVASIILTSLTPNYAMWWSRESGWGRIVGITTEGLSLAATAALAVSGVGCFLFRPWARRTFVIACTVMALSRAGQFIWYYVEMCVTTGGFAASLGPGARVVYVSTEISSVLLGMVFPGLLVWLMTRPGVRRAFGEG